MNIPQSTHPTLSLQNCETSPSSRVPQMSHATPPSNWLLRWVLQTHQSGAELQSLCQPSRFPVLDSMVGEPSSRLQEPPSLVLGPRQQVVQAGSQGWWSLVLAWAGFTPVSSGPLIPQCAACVHSGRAISPFLQPPGPNILLSGLGEAQNLVPSLFGQRVALDEILGGMFLR